MTDRGPYHPRTCQGKNPGNKTGSIFHRAPPHRPLLAGAESILEEGSHESSHAIANLTRKICNEICYNMFSGQDTFDHDRQQKSAIWGIFSTSFGIFSSGLFVFFSKFYVQDSNKITHNLKKTIRSWAEKKRQILPRLWLSWLSLPFRSVPL